MQTHLLFPLVHNTIIVSSILEGTFECGCCCRARGFDVSKEDKRLLKEQHREEISKLARHRITRVALWGLVGDNYESPFDMIDAPSIYGQIANDRLL